MWGITHPDRALGAGCKGRAAATAYNRLCEQQQGPQAATVYMGVRDQQQQEGGSSKNNGSVREGRVLHARAGAEAVVGKDGWWKQEMGRVDGGSGVKHHRIHHTPTRMNESLHSDSFILLNDMCTHRARYDDDERATKA